MIPNNDKKANKKGPSSSLEILSDNIYKIQEKESSFANYFVLCFAVEYLLNGKK
jgi:hypothetical protein